MILFRQNFYQVASHSLLVLFSIGLIPILLGQPIQDTVRSETILKLDQVKRPFTNKQTKWFDKNGFDIAEYNWSNEEINLNLQEALSQRKVSNVVTGMSLISLAIGLQLELLRAGTNEKEFYPRGTGLIFGSGALFLISRVSRTNAKRKLKEANRLKVDTK